MKENKRTIMPNKIHANVGLVSFIWPAYKNIVKNRQRIAGQMIETAPAAA